MVFGECGAALDVGGLFAFALEQQIGGANRSSFVVDFLAEQVNGHFFAVLRGEYFQGFFGDRQHAAGAACAVIKCIGRGLDFVYRRKKQQFCHEADDITRGKVFARFFVVFSLKR